MREGEREGGREEGGREGGRGVRCVIYPSHFLSCPQNSYHTLVGIAMELLDALESAIAGRMVRERKRRPMP